MDRFSPYEYLAFLLPGGLLTMAAWIAMGGSVLPDPGAGLLAILLGVAFVIGHAVASIASWLEPVAWGHRPGQRPDPLWGAFGEGRRYTEADRPRLEGEFRDRFGVPDGLPTLYALGYTRLQQLKLDGHLQVLNQQIGFYRNTAAACLLAAGLHLCVRIREIGSNDVLLLAAYAAGLALFTARYRRFWTYFSDAVIRGVRLIEPTAGRSPTLPE